MVYRNFERNLRSLNVFLEKSDGIRGVKDNNAPGFDDDLPYDLVSRPYYVDSIMFRLDRSASTDFDSE